MAAKWSSLNYILLNSISLPFVPGGFRRCSGWTRRRPFHRLLLEMRLSLLQRHSPLLLLLPESLLRLDLRLLLGMYLRLYQLSTRLAVHALSPGVCHQLRLLPEMVGHRSAVFPGSYLWDNWFVSVEDPGAQYWTKSARREGVTQPGTQRWKGNWRACLARFQLLTAVGHAYPYVLACSVSAGQRLNLILTQSSWSRLLSFVRYLFKTDLVYCVPADEMW